MYAYIGKQCIVPAQHRHCILTHPLNVMAVEVSEKSKSYTMTLNVICRKWLGEDISNHVLGLEEVDLNLLALNSLSNPMHFDVNVLHPAVMLRIS